MRVLGIDPGSAATGFGGVDHLQGRTHHVAHGTLRPPKNAATAERLAFLHSSLCEVVEAHRPEVAAVERVFVARNPRSALVLGQARGAVLAALGAGGVPVCEYAARAVKASLVGTGAATKQQVQAMVTQLLGLSREPAQDAADALAIAICHSSAGRLAELGVSRRSGRRSLRAVARRFS
jgi:crossover junction endodeoxyribonuclease RuvC